MYLIDKGPGSTTKADLPVAFIKVLKVLQHNGLDKVRATLQNNETVTAGSAIYWKARRNILKDYTMDQTSDPTKNFSITIQLDKLKSLSYQWETFDLARAGVKLQDNNMLVSQAWFTNNAQGAAVSVNAYLFASHIQGLIKAASTNSVPIINLKGKGVTDVNSLRSQVWFPIANRRAEIESLVSSTYAGINPEDLVLIANPQLINALLLSTTTLGGDLSRQRLEDGKISQIAEINVIKVPFLGQNYNVNDFDKNESFNLTALDGILVHKEAYAFPTVAQQVFNTINYNTGNPQMIIKLAKNSKNGQALRPTLIQGFKLVGPTNKNTLKK